MAQKTTTLTEAKLKEIIAEYCVEQGVKESEIEWGDYSDIEMLYEKLNAGDDHLVYFDQLGNVVSAQNATICATVYVPELGHSFILEWETLDHYESKEEFIKEMLDLDQQAAELLARITIKPKAKK